ncbi:hypothetical protein SmJEL517_g03975 [Synchytrium microbalum]|uniref:Uncharacterized protein n=1 Tax=Synchytrium microbalum TaxID=1806994 RepID=A0A507C023_9FUNG|nr:uncharacterized protein SmJEL517_g03975 [Synchytrium microbalum]TPX33042.1 hypothetical protein SmJEL517_g03975 [Synchytrium microbalum]
MSNEGDEWAALEAMVAGGFGKRNKNQQPVNQQSSKPQQSIVPSSKPAASKGKSRAAANDSDDDDEDDEDLRPPKARAAVAAASAKVSVGAPRGPMMPAAKPPPVSTPKGVSQEDDDDDMVGPPMALAEQANESMDDGSTDDDDEEEEPDEADVSSGVVPVTSHIQLSDHRKTVSALTLDPAGARLITGSHDEDVKFWDFMGMDGSFKPFRTIEPFEGNPVRDLQFSTSGGEVLVASGMHFAKLYNRDGVIVEEYVKGDPYIRDPKHTKGHVAALTCCRWHPFDRKQFLTASLDSTVRIWDVETKKQSTQVIVVKSEQRGGRTAITSACYSNDGKMIATSGQDGVIRIWGSTAPFLRAAHTISSAHMTGSEISSTTFSLDSRRLLTRATDDTVKLWDLRNVAKPVAVAQNLASFYGEANAVFSPTESVVLAGTSVRKEGFGKLVVLDGNTLKTIKEVNVTESSVVKILWHPKINQIVVGSGNGTINVYYDDVASVRGALLCANKGLRRSAGSGMVTNANMEAVIHVPNGLLKDDGQRKTKRKLAKIRQDPVASMRPELPMTGPGRGGRLGHSIQAGMLQSLIKDNTRNEDPRAAILKYAEQAKNEPYYVDPAYKTTAPDPVFADAVYEDAVEETWESNKKRRQ